METTPRRREPEVGHGPSRPARRPIAFLFSGQGSQHARMAAGLYGYEPAFTAAMDEVFCLLGDEGARIRSDWLSERPGVPIDDVRRAQPLLLAVDHALARMAMSWGARPAALLGHSVGEIVAAVIAEVFSLDDAVRLLRDRVSRVARTPPGGMLAVAAPPGELLPLLANGVSLAAVNGPRQTLLAGLDGPLAAAERRLRQAGYTCARAASRHAFHSPVLEPALAGSAALFAGIRMCPPALPLFSGYTAALMRPEEAADPQFWARQPTVPVLFWQALDALLATDDFLLLDAGPGQQLATLARRHRAVAAGRSAVVAMLPARPGRPAADRRSVLTAAACLRAEGHELTDVAAGTA
jgi:acyl transferase domain-containing protein